MRYYIDIIMRLLINVTIFNNHSILLWIFLEKCFPWLYLLFKNWELFRIELFYCRLLLKHWVNIISKLGHSSTRLSGGFTHPIFGCYFSSITFLLLFLRLLRIPLNLNRSWRLVSIICCFSCLRLFNLIGLIILWRDIRSPLLFKLEIKAGYLVMWEGVLKDLLKHVTFRVQWCSSLKATLICIRGSTQVFINISNQLLNIFVLWSISIGFLLLLKLRRVLWLPHWIWRLWSQFSFSILLNLSIVKWTNLNRIYHFLTFISILTICVYLTFFLFHSLNRWIRYSFLVVLFHNPLLNFRQLQFCFVDRKELIPSLVWMLRLIHHFVAVYCILLIRNLI